MVRLALASVRSKDLRLAVRLAVRAAVIWVER
jgi:hypothetical protein